MIRLYAPPAYWLLSPEVRERLVNGCGPGGWKFDLIPDTVWGLSIREACDIHDYMYAMGSSIAEKDEADRTFLNNMLRLVEGSCFLLRPLRRLRAWTYYQAVHRFGGPSFWGGKNPEDAMGRLDPVLAGGIGL